MDSTDLFIDALARVQSATHHAVDGLEPSALEFRPDARANSIAWLVWHLTRIQDDHIADVAGRAQVWESSGWHERFALPFGASETGYGHSSEEVAAVRVSDGALLTGYYDAVHRESIAYIATLEPDDFDAIVDGSWDPPVTLGVRLVSVLADDLQHAGQAAYIRGIVERRAA